MAGLQAVNSGHAIAPLGWLLVGFRLILIILLLVIFAPLHLALKLFGPTRFFPRLFLASIGAVAGLRIKTTGRPIRHALLVSNHVTWIDIPALANAAGTAFVAHDGLAVFPVLKWLCEMNETVFIARNDRTTIAQQVDKVRTAIDTRGTLTIFPEGTTSDGTGMLPIKSALLSAVTPVPDGAAVQPVVMEYHDAPDVSWVGEEPGLDNFCYILSRLKPVRLTVHFFQPLQGNALRDRKTIAAAARDDWATVLG